MASGEQTSTTQRLLDLWNSISLSARVAVAIIAAGAVVALTLAITNLNQPTATAKVPILGGYEFNPESRQSAISAFQTARLSDYTILGNQILVPESKEADYLAALAASDAGLPGNADEALDKYIEQQRTWWASSAESARLFHVAQQRRVARVIESFPEIVHATVLVSQPADRGTLMARNRPGKAAVKVTTDNGQPLAPKRIEQIQHLVDGAFEEILTPDAVDVVDDGLTSGLGKDGPDGTSLPAGSSQYLMTKAAFAMQVENKIRELFSDLKGLRVSVNAELDPRFRREQHVEKNDKGTIKKESGDSSTIESAAAPAPPGNEPGTRTNVDLPGVAPNQGAQAASTVSGNSQNDETFEREYALNKTLTDQSFVDFEPVQIGVVVRYRIPPEETPAEGEPAEPAGPTAEEIRTMIASLGYPGVTIDTVSVSPYVGEEPEPVEIPGPSIVELTLAQAPSIGLGVLGISAIIVAFLIARRGTVPPHTPSVEEEEEDEGEGEEGEAEEPEFEKDEATIKAEKIQEKVNQLVSESPDSAAALIRRWIQQEE